MAKLNKSERKKMIKKRGVDEAESVGELNDKVLHFFKQELDVDIIDEYKRLKSVAKISADQLLDRMKLILVINSCADDARAANLIYLKARAAREHFRIDFDRKMRDLNRRAMEKITAWMSESKTTKKQITKDMIQQEIATDEELSEEYRDLISKQEEMKAIRDDCALLLKEWSDRKWTLRAQAQLVAAEREVKLPTEED